MSGDGTRGDAPGAGGGAHAARRASRTDVRTDQAWPSPHTLAGREAIAELFLREYHRLGGAAARAAASDARAAQLLRRRAIVWRTTAGRVRAAVAARWPAWLLAHLAACESLPVVGAEYGRQRAYLERVTGCAAGCVRPSPASGPM